MKKIYICVYIYIYSRVNTGGGRSLVAIAEGIFRWTFRFYSPRSLRMLWVSFVCYERAVPLFLFPSRMKRPFFIALSCLVRVDC